MPKIIRWCFSFALVAIAVMAIAKFANLPDKPMQDPNGTVTEAVKLKVPLDLTGEWRSDNPKVTAKVLNGTIEVESTTEDGGIVRWWYGTFDNPQDGKTGVISKGISHPEKFYLSSADEKDFVYHEGMLKFQLSVMGVTRVVEMKRV
jgi:hypothetical protein